MSENKENETGTLLKFGVFHENHENSRVKQGISKEEESNYTFQAENSRATFEVLSNQFSLGNTGKISNNGLKEKKEKDCFLMDNMSFGKKTGRNGKLFGKGKKTRKTRQVFEEVNLYSGKSQFSNQSIKNNHKKTLKTLKTSEKSKNSNNSKTSAKSKIKNIQGISNFYIETSNKIKKRNSKNINSPNYKSQRVMTSNSGKRSSNFKGSPRCFESSKTSFKSKKTKKNCGKESSKDLSHQLQKNLNSVRYSKEIGSFSSSSKKNSISQQKKIFYNKNDIIKVFEIGRKTPNSKIKKLSLDYNRKIKKMNSQKTRKHLSIHINNNEEDFAKLNRQYFSSRNSNVMEFRPFTAGKSSILKMRRESNQNSNYDSKIKFSNFIMAEQNMKRFSEIRTPNALFSKYLYKRKSAVNNKKFSKNKSPNFKKKKKKFEVLEIKKTNILNKNKQSFKAKSKLSSRKLASFFSKNNPKNKSAKLLASQKLQKLRTPSKNKIKKKNSFGNISKRISGRKMKSGASDLYESLNENSMIHIQNRVDIETLINSKLVSSRNKNTFLNKTGNQRCMNTQNKSETSILFGRKTYNNKNTSQVQTPKIVKIKIGRNSSKNNKSKSKGKNIRKSKGIKKVNEESWNLYRPNQFKKNLHINNKVFINKKKKSSSDKNKYLSNKIKKASIEPEKKFKINKKGSRSKKIILRKNSKLILSTRKMSKTPELSRKTYTKKKKKSKKFKSQKLVNSMGKKNSIKNNKNNKLFDQIKKSKKKFFNTQLKNSFNVKEGLKSLSFQQNQGLISNKILLFRNIKEKMTTSFKKKQIKSNLNSRVCNAKSNEPIKSKKKKLFKSNFKSQKNICKLKIGSISPKSNLQSMRLRPYSKTPNGQSNVLKNLVKKWPKKRCKISQNKKRGLIESVSYIEKSVMDSRMRSRENGKKIVSIYNPGTSNNTDKLKIANLFSKTELKKKIQKNQKENFSKFNLSNNMLRESKSKNENRLFQKQDKYKNLMSIKFNLDKKKKENIFKTPKYKNNIDPNFKLKKAGFIGCFKKFNLKLIKKQKIYNNSSFKKQHLLFKIKKYLKKQYIALFFNKKINNFNQKIINKKITKTKLPYSRIKKKQKNRFIQKDSNFIQNKMKMINVNSNFIKKLNNITNKSKKVYKNENDFSFMDSIEKLISQNEKLTSESMNSLPDISTNHWPNLIKEKKKNIKNKIKNYFEQKNKNQTITKIQRGRFTTPKDLKMEGLSSPKKEYNRTPKNFSSKKIQIRISKSNNINKKHLNESLEKKNKIEFSILESHRKKHFGSSHKKNKIDRRERMKSELPNINVKLQKIEKKFSTRFSNCLPFPEKLYKLLGVLGKGSYGLVFLAVHLISGEKVAIKAIKKNRNNDMARNYEKITNEIEIFSKLNHKNIISLYEVFENRKYIFLVTEYAEKGDLLSLLQRSGPFSESQIYIVIKDIINALMFLHKNNILHRDIKLDNILLDKNNNLKLCDFGISLKVNKDTFYTDRCGTPAYIAPEIIISKYKGFKSDYWSLGVTLFILLTASPPFKAKSFNSIKGLILKKPVEFPKDLGDITEDLKTLIK